MLNNKRKCVIHEISGDYNPLNDQNKGSRNGICNTDKIWAKRTSDTSRYEWTKLLVREDNCLYVV